MNCLPVKLFVTIEYNAVQAFIIKEASFDVVNECQIETYRKLKSSVDPLPDSLEKIKTIFVNDIMSLIPYTMKQLGIISSEIEDIDMLNLLQWLSTAYKYNHIVYRLNGHVCITVFNEMSDDDIFDRYFYFNRDNVVTHTDVPDAEKKYIFNGIVRDNKRYITLL